MRVCGAAWFDGQMSAVVRAGARFDVLTGERLANVSRPWAVADLDERVWQPIGSPLPSGPRRIGGIGCQVSYFKLETTDGAPAEPLTFRSAVPDWRVGHAIPIAKGRTLRVVVVRDEGEDEAPVLVVEDVAE
jgi:hypothetical protein